MNLDVTLRAARNHIKDSVLHSTIDDREKIFEHFWKKIDWAERKIYVKMLINCTPVVRGQRVKDQDEGVLSHITLQLAVKGKLFARTCFCQP